MFIELHIRSNAEQWDFELYVCGIKKHLGLKMGFEGLSKAEGVKLLSLQRGLCSEPMSEFKLECTVSNHHRHCEGQV